jgi:hypothetical protein
VIPSGFQCATANEIRTTVIVFDFHWEVLGDFHMQNGAQRADDHGGRDRRARGRSRRAGEEEPALG